MTAIQQSTDGQDSNVTPSSAHAGDRVSDPALSTAPGHDWTDEGGATPTGPATFTDGNV
jgi:hypothetical protein